MAPRHLRPKPEPAVSSLCYHGVRRSGLTRCTICEEEESETFRTRVPDELVIRDHAGKLIAVHRIPPHLRPKKKGPRMGKRPTLSPKYGNADSRPRVHLRLIEHNGQPAIAFRTHMGARESIAATIELALGEALQNVADEAVLIWEGITTIPKENTDV